MANHYDEKEARYIENQGHFDADGSVFLARQLEHIRAQVLEVKHAPMNAFVVFPVTTDIPEGAETAVQRIYDNVGSAEVISNYADDLPRVDILAQENAVKVHSIGNAYGYNENEISNARYAGVNLDANKAKAARRYIDLKLNNIAWRGDKAHNIIGFLDNPNISEYALPADGANSSTQLSKKSEEQVIRDINKFLRAVPVATNEVEHVNTILLSPDVYSYLATTRLSYSDRTLLEFLKQTHSEVTRWMPVGELKGAADDGSDLMIAGYFDPSYIKFEIPQRFKQLPVERRNLEYIINCMARVSGVNVTMPFAFVTAKGV